MWSHDLEPRPLLVDRLAQPFDQGAVDAVTDQQSNGTALQGFRRLANDAEGRRGPIRLRRTGRETDCFLGTRFELVWGFSGQVVVFWLVAGSLFGAGRPFFVPSPAIRFAEHAEGVKEPKRLAQLGGLPPSDGLCFAAP
jgi:hypothetical protein